MRRARTRTLVLRGGALGDFVLTLPVLATLGRGGVAPDLCAHPAHAALARAGGLAGELHRIDDPRWDPLWSGGDLTDVQILLAGVRRAVVLRPVDRDAVAGRLAECGVSEVVVHDPRPPEDGSVHAADHLLSAIGNPPAIPALSLPVAQLDPARTRLHALLPSGAPPVLLMPGAGGERKRWPLVRFTGLAEALRRDGLGVVWVTGPVEDERLAGSVGPLHPRISDADPLETAALCAAADVVVGNDTGTSHLAAAVGTPVVALFGPTDERTWGPRGRGVVRVLRSDVHPAGEDCREGCPPGRPGRCLAGIGAGTVRQVVLDVVSVETAPGHA